MWYHVISCDIMWYHVVSWDIMWYHVIYDVLRVELVEYPTTSLCSGHWQLCLLYWTKWNWPMFYPRLFIVFSRYTVGITRGIACFHARLCEVVHVTGFRSCRWVHRSLDQDVRLDISFEISHVLSFAIPYEVYIYFISFVISHVWLYHICYIIASSEALWWSLARLYGASHAIGAFRMGRTTGESWK